MPELPAPVNLPIHPFGHSVTPLSTENWPNITVGSDISTIAVKA